MRKWVPLVFLLALPMLALAQPYGDDPNADYDNFNCCATGTDIDDPGYSASSTGSPWNRTSGTGTGWELDGATVKPMGGNGLHYMSDLGSPNQYLLFRLDGLQTYVQNWIVIRGTDNDNFIGVTLRGVGANGMRIATVTAGVEDDTHMRWQGAAGRWYKVEAVGTTFTAYSASSQDGPWAPVTANTGTNPATISVHSSATIPGLVSHENASKMFQYAEFGLLESEGPSTALLRRGRGR